jgi:hypothetical protein
MRQERPGAGTAQRDLGWAARSGVVVLILLLVAVIEAAKTLD